MNIANPNKSFQKNKKYAVISDIHGNLEAFQAVLKAIEQEEVGKIFCLGDLVGYGPNPNECIDLARAKSDIIVAGNHDWAVIGLTDTGYFNPYAKAAVDWTADTMTAENHGFLKELPIIKRVQEKGLFLVHATPENPDQWNYILTYQGARKSFEYLPDRFCFIGHSHVPAIIEEGPHGELTGYSDQIIFRNGCRYIINVGSVGQPRDGNPDAAYAIFEDDKVIINRIPYDISLTQKKMREVKLPEYLIERLVCGR